MAVLYIKNGKDNVFIIKYFKKKEIAMDNQEIMQKVLKILGPYAKNKEALNNANETTNILKDLEVNSSRLVDIILALEDEFDIEIDDSEADKVQTVGAAIELIKKKVG
jgi:acyl carrier protein